MMEKRATSREWIMGMAGMWSMLGGLCWMLGLACVIIGIIGEATDNIIGLMCSSWYLLAISAFVASVSWYIGWAVAVYFRAKEAPKE